MKISGFIAGFSANEDSKTSIKRSNADVKKAKRVLDVGKYIEFNSSNSYVVPKHESKVRIKS